MSQHWKLPTLVIALGLGWASNTVKANEFTIEEPISHVKTYVVEESLTVMEQRFPATVVAKDTVTVSFEVSGRLIDLAAQNGSIIPRGAPIAMLNPAPFEREVRRAEIALDQAERQYVRVQQLSQSNILSEAAAKDTKAAVQLAEDALYVAIENLDDAQFLAPFDAIVADRIASPFTTIEPGTPVVRLHDVSSLHVEFDVPERLIQAVEIANLEFEVAFPGVSERVPTVVSGFRPEASELGQNYRVSVDLPSDIPGLVPGATADVFARVQMEPFLPKAPLLPSAAVTIGPDRSAFVMVLEEQGANLIVRQTPVRIVTDTGSRFQVSGLSRGTEIVATGGHLLNDGQRVARFEDVPNGEGQ